MKRINIIYYVLFLGLLVFTKTVNSQNEITIEASQVFAKFKFVDSQGKTDNSYQQISAGAYGLGYRYTSKKNILIKVNAGVSKLGSSLVYESNSYAWSLQYLDLKIGAGYILNKWKLKPYFMVAPYYAYLLKANQTINSQNYDIKKSNSIKGSDYGIICTPGLKFSISDNFSIYGEYNYIYGLQNNEVNSKQQLYNRAYSFSLGMALKLSKNSPQWLQEK